MSILPNLSTAAWTSLSIWSNLEASAWMARRREGPPDWVTISEAVVLLVGER